LGLDARHRLFLRDSERALPRAGSQYSLTLAAGRALPAAGFIALQRYRKKTPHPHADDRARALSPAHSAEPVERRGFRLSLLQYLRLRADLRLGGAVLSAPDQRQSIAALVATFGPVAPSRLPEFVVGAIVTLVLFLAYELGYWFNHALSQPRALPVGIPQGASFRDGADAGHQHPRASGL
jgi:hypothetical protein